MAIDAHEQMRAFRTPSLRGTAGRASYMHAGQTATLEEEVIVHYAAASGVPLGHSELRPLELGKGEIAQIIAFLGNDGRAVTARPPTSAKPA